MIIVYSPFRISFFGGGTDIPQWFKKNNGVTISCTINRGAYVSLNNDFYRHDEKKIKISYKNTEIVKNFDEIKLPIVREVLKKYWNSAIEINYNSDLPSRSGMGTSSAFSSALIKGLYFLKDKKISNKDLAKRSINLERNILSEPGGYQDQIATSYGGFNRVDYYKNGSWKVNKMKLSKNFLNLLEQNIYLIPLKKNRLKRNVNYWDRSFQQNYNSKMQEIFSIAKDGYNSILSENFEEFNYYLDTTWNVKKNMNDISFKEANEIYDKLIKLGAFSGKLLGSGGGGFLLMLMSNKTAVKAIKNSILKNIIKVKFVDKGTNILFDGKF